ncbi:MAG: M1 family aminopeptidase [Xanthomonadales bacterium]|nr:M1 family aminopeptidase [Xanthomonadales bacterium]
MRAIFLLLATGVLSLSAMAEEFRQLDRSILPVEQAIQLRLDPFQDDFSGETTIRLKALEPFSNFALHARELDLDEVKLSGGDPGEIEHSVDEVGRVDFRLENELPAGEYDLAISFKGSYNRNSVGLYKTEVGEDAYLYTQFEMQDARRAFPCFDEPVFKFPYQMTLTVPDAMTAVSNTPVTNSQSEDGWTTAEFARTKPLSSYHLAVAVGEFDSIEMTGLDVPGRIYTTKGQAHLARTAAEYTPKIMAALERYFDRPYPYAKIDFLALPEFPFGAMENVGAVTYRDDILLVDPATASPRDLAGMASVIAHELAHMWYGNLVTMEWWNDLWLNEAFATWMARKIMNQEYPEFRLHLSLPQTRAMVSDARPSTRPIRRPVASEADILDGLGLAYSKGMTILGMVEQWIGEEAFQKAMWNYLEEHEFANAKADDLWGALADASGKDVRSVLASYLDQSGFPLIEVAPKGPAYTVSQRRFLNAGVEAENRTWTTPLTLKYSVDGEVRTHRMILDEPSETVSLGEDVEWVLPDAGGKGYYRWNLPPEQLKSVAENAATNLSDRERIALLSNLSALLDADQITGGDFLAVLSRFAGDPVPEVLDEVMDQLNKVHDQMLTDQSRDAFAAHVGRILKPALTSIGMQPRDGEPLAVANIRPRLVTWLGRIAGDPDVVREAKAYARRYFANGLEDDSRLAREWLRVAAKTGDEDMFERLQLAYERTEIPDERSMLLATLASFGTGQLRLRALDYALTDAVRPPDMATVVVYSAADPEGEQIVFDWMLENYATIAGKAPPFMVPLIPLYTPTSCDVGKLEKAQAFFSDESRKVEGTERSLARLEDTVMDCHRLRERTADDVALFLSAQGT